MRLSRKQSIVLSICVLAGFFTCASLLSKTQHAQTPIETVYKQTLPEKISQKAEEAIKKIPTPKTKLIMGEFHRSETKDGKKIWEVESKEGRYDPQTKKARLKDAFLRFYHKNGDVITVSTDKAEVSIQDGKLNNVRLTGNVVITFNDVKLITERATMENNNQTVIIPNKVIIKKNGLHLEGQKLKANLETKEFELINNVFTKIDAKALKEVKKNIDQKEGNEENKKESFNQPKKKNKKKNKNKRKQK